ncbi:MAG: hypothetical protein KF779_17580 [Hyphomonadaceae bacterium]|nr:hypothetical protein [Hyphomonadaceae bacterium]
MTQTFDLNIDINSVQWIRSLRAGEESWNQKIVDDVEAECKRQGMAFSLHDVQTIAEFERVLRSLEREAADKGVRPLIHIDMHGGKDAGLEIAGEGKCIAWPQVADLLSAVNIAADRNLCVVSAACEGLHVISEVSINKPCPFAILIAPEKSILISFLEDNTLKFYQALLQTDDIVAGYEAHLSSDLTMFNAEKQFARALTLYIHDHCVGPGADARIDGLIEEIKKTTALSPADEAAARLAAKAGIEPSQKLIDDWAPTFLGRVPTFSIDDIMKAVGTGSTP